MPSAKSGESQAVARGASEPEPLVMVLTPVKNARKFLPRYFELLENLAYDPQRLSLGLLDSDSDDRTFEAVGERLPELRRRYRR